MQSSATATTSTTATTNSTTTMLQRLSSTPTAPVATSLEHQQAIDRALALDNAIKAKQEAVATKSALLKRKVDELQDETTKLTRLNEALEKAGKNEFDVNLEDSDLPLFQNAKRSLTSAAEIFSRKSKISQDLNICTQIIANNVATVTEQNQQLTREIARLREETSAMQAALARAGVIADNQTADTAPRRSF